MQTVTLPPVTDAHRLAAFEAMHWPGWTYEAAMRYDMRRRLIEARAAHLRTAQFKQQARCTTQTVRRLDPATGQWCCQRVPGPYADVCTASEPSLF